MQALLRRLLPAQGSCAGASFNFAEGGGSDVESGRGSVACEVGAPGTEEACLVAAG